MVGRMHDWGNGNLWQWQKWVVAALTLLVKLWWWWCCTWKGKRKHYALNSTFLLWNYTREENTQALSTERAVPYRDWSTNTSWQVCSLWTMINISMLQVKGGTLQSPVVTTRLSYNTLLLHFVHIHMFQMVLLWSLHWVWVSASLNWQGVWGNKWKPF